MSIYDKVLAEIETRKNEIKERSNLRDRLRLLRIQEEKAEIEKVAETWTDRNMTDYIREHYWNSDDDPPELFHQMIKLRAACEEMKVNYCVLAAKIRSKDTNINVLRLKPKKARTQYYIHIDDIEKIKRNRARGKKRWYIV